MASCIESGYSTATYGYPQKTIGSTLDGTRRTVRLNRLVYVEYHGLELSDIEGMVVRHTCDNTWCVQPLHLILGTTQDNVADRVARGRTQMGEAHYSAKLTEDEVRAIRIDMRSQRKIASDYGVNKSTVSNIKTMKTWKQVPA